MVTDFIGPARLESGPLGRPGQEKRDSWVRLTLRLSTLASMTGALVTADWELFGTEVLRIVVALVLGGSIGLERELRERAAGFRTHILVAMGASAFTLASIYGFQLTAEQAAGGQTYDPSRVAAQIVSGIGFLGAGAIIRHGMSVRGLTTAASLWAVAAIGMLSGAGMYGLATATTLLVLVSLAGLRFLEHHIAGTRG